MNSFLIHDILTFSIRYFGTHSKDINGYQWVLGEISCGRVSLIIRRIVSGWHP